jgi:betaine-aldehyde dehydrogenase
VEARAIGRELRRLRALNLIGGHWQQAGGAREGDSINPANGREVGAYAAGGAADARQAIDAARRAFERGGLSRDPLRRAVLLLRWADRLAKRGDLAHLLTLENGKVLAQSQHEIATAIACLRHHARTLMKAAAGAAPPDAARPAGVVAVLVSWHAPVALLIASLAPALAAGCCAVVRPARQSAQVAAAVVGELAAVEGLPSGVVNLVSEAGQEVTPELVASGGVDIVCQRDAHGALGQHMDRRRGKGTAAGTRASQRPHSRQPARLAGAGRRQHASRPCGARRAVRLPDCAEPIERRCRRQQGVATPAEPLPG